MTEHRGIESNIRGRTMFECVDRDKLEEPFVGSYPNTDGVFIAIANT